MVIAAVDWSDFVSKTDRILSSGFVVVISVI